MNEAELKVHYEGRYDELVKIIESFERLEKSKEWETLKELVFDKEISSLERQLLQAALESPLDIAKVYILQGERKQARKYELNRYIETLKKQLIEVKSKIQ